MEGRECRADPFGGRVRRGRVVTIGEGGEFYGFLAGQGRWEMIGLVGDGRAGKAGMGIGIGMGLGLGLELGLELGGIGVG